MIAIGQKMITMIVQQMFLNAGVVYYALTHLYISIGQNKKWEG